jgi:hypothetical protein
VAKVGVAADEADEAENWLLVIRDSEMTAGSDLAAMISEAGELRAILWASFCTARQNQEHHRAAEEASEKPQKANGGPRTRKPPLRSIP